ncbi:MAG: Hsp20/alpha crystallin family protein [Patescibacteria group bacterium]
MQEQIITPPWQEVDQAWSVSQDEGQLLVDIYRDKDMLVIRSPMAGVKPDDVDISIHNDMLTIRGKRESFDEINEDDWFYQECYWGGFSRSLILPADVHGDQAQASLKNGVLEIRVPIRVGAQRVTVRSIEE